MLVAIVLAIYGSLVELEALLTYRQAGSKNMLLAGLLSGMFVMVAVVLVILDFPIGRSVGAGVTLAMMGVFGHRYRKTRVFFPSGVMMIISIITLGAIFRLRG